jgi:hypothetical protein
MQEYMSPSEQLQRSEPRRIGDILAELLSQYQSRFPNARVAILQTRQSLVAEPYASDAPVAGYRDG